MALNKHRFIMYTVTTTGLVSELRANHWEIQKDRSVDRVRFL